MIEAGDCKGVPEAGVSRGPGGFCHTIGVMRSDLRPLHAFAFFCFVLLTGSLAAAQTDPLLDSVSPVRWKADLLPEAGPELDLPEYFGPADRALFKKHPEEAAAE